MELESRDLPLSRRPPSRHSLVEGSFSHTKLLGTALETVDWEGQSELSFRTGPNKIATTALSPEIRTATQSISLLLGRNEITPSLPAFQAHPLEAFSFLENDLVPQYSNEYVGREEVYQIQEQSPATTLTMLK